MANGTRCLLALILASISFSSARAQLQTIYVPTTSGSEYWRGEYRFSKPISVTDGSGKKHNLSEAILSDTMDSNDAQKMGFARAEANVVFQLATEIGCYGFREKLRATHAPCYQLYVPIAEIKNIQLQPGEKKVHKFYPRDDRIPPFVAQFDYEGRPRDLQGTEDLSDFGKAKFDSSLDEVREIVLPGLPQASIKVKSHASALVTEVGGKQHRLRDVRLAGDFYRGEAGLKLDVAKIASIEVHDASDRGRVKCTVTLRSGAQQEFEWSFGHVAGKGDHWYEGIHAEAIASLQVNPPEQAAASR